VRSEVNWNDKRWK